MFHAIQTMTPNSPDAFCGHLQRNKKRPHTRESTNPLTVVTLPVIDWHDSIEVRVITKHHIHKSRQPFVHWGGVASSLKLNNFFVTVLP